MKPNASGSRQRRRKSFADLPAFGMWKDREDMKDPVAWVRKQREARMRALSRLMSDLDKSK